MRPDPLESVLAKDPGDSFEEIFWNLLRRRYRPEQLVYIPATMGGDHGIEGFSSDGIAYQCYADRDSLTLRNRTDKQKKKLYEDTVKLKEHKDKLAKVLGAVVVGHYFLCVPEYHAAELVAYAAVRAEAVRGYGLAFIADDFEIRIKMPADYPAELAAAMADGAAKALVPTPIVEDEHVALFSDDKPELVRVMDEKLAVLAQASPGADVVVLRDRLIRSFLAKEQVMEALREYPETWEGVERRRALRQEELELESELSPESPDRRVMELVKDYKDDLIVHGGGVREADARRLAWGQAGEWLMRCPLHFRNPA
jgi:hypothetical protein